MEKERERMRQIKDSYTLELIMHFPWIYVCLVSRYWIFNYVCWGFFFLSLHAIHLLALNIYSILHYFLVKWCAFFIVLDDADKRHCSPVRKLTSFYESSTCLCAVNDCQIMQQCNKSSCMRRTISFHFVSEGEMENCCWSALALAIYVFDSKKVHNSCGNACNWFHSIGWGNCDTKLATNDYALAINLNLIWTKMWAKRLTIAHRPITINSLAN